MQIARQMKSPYINSSDKYADKLLPRMFHNDTDEIKVYVSATREPVVNVHTRLTNYLIHGTNSDANPK